jgi:hypothetical protein
MSKQATYGDLFGREWALPDLDAEERRLLAEIRRRARSHPDWNDFENYWSARVDEFYDARGLGPKDYMQRPVYLIAQDLGGRMAIAAGFARMPDYVDEIEWLIRTRYKSRRAFCKATGISEAMLSHVLAGRKHLAIDTLAKALARIGYRIHIAPLPVTKRRKKSPA